jgi:hypothetical protein
MFTDSINFFINAWNKTLGGKFGHSIEPLKKSSEEVTPAKTFAESEKEMRALIEPGAQAASNYLTESLAKTREILGLDQKLSANDNTKATALQRLNALIDEQIKKREAVKTGEQAENGEIVRAFDTKEYLAKQEIALNEDLLRIKRQLSQLDNDFTKTNAEKYSGKTSLLAQEVETYKMAMAKNDYLINQPDVANEDKLLLGKKNERLASGLVGAQDSLDKMGPDPNSFRDQFTSVFTDLQNQFGTVATEMATMFKDVFNSAISSISQGITGLILGTKTWGQALMQIGTSILTTIIQAIVQMGVRWILTRLMMAIAGKTIESSMLAATAGIAAGYSAVWAVPATLATIASYGGAAAEAPGAIALAEGITMAESLTGFAQGGYTGAGGKYEPAGIVHRGEIVWSQDDIARNGGVGMVEALRAGDVAEAGGNQVSISIHHWGDNAADMERHIRTNPDIRHAIVDAVTQEVRFVS